MTQIGNDKLIADMAAIVRWAGKQIGKLQQQDQQMAQAAAAIEKLKSENAALTKELAAANAHIAAITPDVLDAADKAAIASVNAVTIVPPKANVPPTNQI